MLDYGEQFLPSGEQFKWNSHSISLAQECLRKYSYRMIEKWGEGEPLSVHLWFGSIYANAQQEFYLALARGESREEAIDSAINLALVESWDHDLTSEGRRVAGTGTPHETDDPNKTRFTLIRTLVWYFEEFRDDLPVRVINGAPAVETRFTVDLADDNLLVGTIDRLIDYSGEAFVMDQKTTKSTIGSYYWDQWKPSMQMSAYTFAGRIVYDIPVKGVIIDAAQIAVGFSRFARNITYRTGSELEEWLEHTMYHIEAARRAVRENFFPMNTASCNNFGGCPFRRVCSKSPESRKAYLEHFYSPEPAGAPASGTFLEAINADT